ncbi:MAG: TrkH family potassium uptake protein [Chlamydiales bacterium]
MVIQEIFRFLGRYLFYFSLILLLPLAIAIFYDIFAAGELPYRSSVNAFTLTTVVSGLLSLLFYYLGKNSPGTIHRKESILLVAVIWFLTAAISSLPFFLSGTLTNPLDALFESMSGLTTTGATVMGPTTIAPLIDHSSGEVVVSGIEAASKPILFWRSFLQWLGGMGIVLLFIAILPALSMGGRLLFEAEVTGPNKESLKPRIQETAGLLWKIYLALTIFQLILLLVTNPLLPFFDALTLSLSTISTGGFCIKNEGIIAYHSAATEWVTLLFMILGSINFTLYFHCIKGKIYRTYEPEFFAFLLSLVIGGVAISVSLLKALPLSSAIKTGFFQAISTQTSTGFSMMDGSRFPFATQFLLLLLTFIGGMSGSTAGGIKIARFYIFFHVIANKIETIFRPSTVRCLKIGMKEITDKTALTVLIFFCLIILLTILGSFLLILDGLDGMTAFSVIASTINNGGLIFVTPAGDSSYAFLPPLSKLVSIIWMAMGRLELFILLVFLVPSFWKK